MEMYFILQFYHKQQAMKKRKKLKKGWLLMKGIYPSRISNHAMHASSFDNYFVLTFYVTEIQFHIFFSYFIKYFFL